MQVNRAKYYESERGSDLRINPEKRRHFAVSSKRIQENHHEIKRMIFLGWKNVEIARKLGITEVMVSNVRNSPVIQSELKKMHGARDKDVIDVAQKIREFAPTCVELLERVVTGKGSDGKQASIALRAKTAENFLDRAGFAPPKKIQSESVVTYFTKDEIEELKQRAFGNGDVIDVTPEETKNG